MGELKRLKGFLIVARMKVPVLLITLAIATALPLAAQDMSFGLLVGGSGRFNDDEGFNLSDPVREVFFGVELEPSTIFKIKGGQIDSDDAPGVGAPGIEDEGKIEYISALVEYKFSESFGSSGVFAGPGFYRQRFGSLEDSNYGIAVGGNATFPITRRFALMGEIAYHWTNFEDRYSFLNIGGGLKINF